MKLTSFSLEQKPHNFLLRLGEIVSHPKVVAHPSSSNMDLEFQRGYLPLIAYLSSEQVIKSSVRRDVNALFNQVDKNVEDFCRTVTEVLQSTLAAEKIISINSPATVLRLQSFYHILKPLTTMLHEYLTRFKNVAADHDEVYDLVHLVKATFETWASSLARTPPTFVDSLSDQSPEDQAFIISLLRRNLEKLCAIVDRDAGRIQAPVVVPSTSTKGRVVGDAELIKFDPPGGRHDNDFERIQDIQLAPTHEELTTDRVYLPANLAKAPHHLPSDSMDRVFDLQFRMFREELIAPLRESVLLILEDLRTQPFAKTVLAKVIKSGGGAYRRESAFMQIFVGVNFLSFALGRDGFSLGLSLLVPPDGRGKRSATFWLSRSGLNDGFLVALIWKQKVWLGRVTSSESAVSQSYNSVTGRVIVQVAFFNPLVELHAVQALRSEAHGQNMILVKSSVLWEAVRPYLEALKTNEATAVPFSEILVHGVDLSHVVVSPPTFAETPGFEWNISCLLRGDSNLGRPLTFTVNNAASILDARILLKAHGTLDESQADSLIDILTREVALVQGPPGTGKTYLGIQLIKVYVANNVGPILLIAETNEAIDHMVHDIVEAGITKSLVRLGNRSKDELVQAYSISQLEELNPASAASRRPADQAYHVMKDFQEEMASLHQTITKQQLSVEDMDDWLAENYPAHHRQLTTNPPPWISALLNYLDAGGDGWTQVDKKKKKSRSTPKSSRTTFSIWEEGEDLDLLERLHRPPVSPPSSSSFSNRQPPPSPTSDWNNMRAALDDALSASQPTPEDEPHLAFGFSNAQSFTRNYGPLPPLPRGDYSTGDLRRSRSLWEMSRKERTSLYKTLYDEAWEKSSEKQFAKFKRLRKEHERARKDHDDLRTDIRISILRKTKIVAGTTTGVAKMASLMKGFSPSIVVVEEAGQTLEAHVLATLSPSIQHLVLIGDPLQLRSTINNYQLSVDSRTGALLRRFDVSLLERLSSGGLPMSKLENQRRMRPEISSLIRNTLYPRLQDNPLVTEYPRLRGMKENVFFLDHNEPEGGGRGVEAVSKHNVFEVAMVRSLVRHFLRQGVYSKKGGIVVICLYLGQVLRVREALSTLPTCTVVVEEKDLAQLSALGEEAQISADPAQIRRGTASDEVRVTSVDNYQGQEGDVIIVSTVRSDAVGFVGNVNRINVAVSRGKHGMIILGHREVSLLSKSPMWSTICDELESHNQLGSALPISCYNHPEEVSMVSRPEEILLVSPDGGCLRPCDAALSCGHLCTFKCHSDDPNHIASQCHQPCTKLLDVCHHPCSAECFETCPPCKIPIKNVLLSCGHVSASVPCHLAQKPEEIRCVAVVKKKLPNCEHDASMACWFDPANFDCTSRCGKDLGCCSKVCEASCSTCSKLSLADPPQLDVVVVRSVHPPHPCGRILFCNHGCLDDCAQGHQCSPCRSDRLRACDHGKAGRKEVCSSLANPCELPCSWTCSHRGSCALPCGAACSRLPCDERCKKTLRCGHRCPSSESPKAFFSRPPSLELADTPSFIFKLDPVCGERCPTACLECSPAARKNDVVDVLLGRTLEEVSRVVGQDGIENLVVTLPCSHSWTVETLDGIVELSNFYEQDEDGKFIRAKTAPEGFAKLPTCPTCRAPFFVQRYSRPIKKALLDLSEHNLVTISSSSILAVRRLVSNLDIDGVVASVDNLPRSSFSSPPSTTFPKAAEKITNILREAFRRRVPVEVAPFQARLSETFGIDPQQAKLWQDKGRILLQVYRIATEIAGRPAPHQVSWDSAFGTLFRMEESNPRTTVEGALSLARRALGQPRPQGKQRYAVEGILETVYARNHLARIAQSFASGGSSSAPPEVGLRWNFVAESLLQSSLQDAELAQKMTVDTRMDRQFKVCQVAVLNATFLLFRHNIQQELSESITQERRHDLVEMSARMSFEAAQEAKSSPRGETSLVFDNEEGRTWLEEHHSKPLKTISDDWATLTVSLGRDTFVQPVTRLERLEIIKAMELYSAGHFYQCINGHPFVIGECGGAMQQARCPECGETIGGSNHTLAAGNTFDNEMEDLSIEAGLDANPFPWGRR
ncbi:hypothetical protein BDY24DRAFT_350847 [Mrakia frigida]|uniref:uncharacterized protein n=1 Tax=Mrakia frigida TaxID=29902 RepID=UPI003FCBFCBA